MKNSYGYTKKTNLSFEEAIIKTIQVLKDKGFGVLSDIDVKRTLKEKLNVDFKRYRILGACNPPNAYKALQVEEEIGLLLPCNVIVYEKEGASYVSTILPSVAFTMVENEELESVAKDVEALLKEVINNI